jgi:16S rRNA (guanine527-N7)-methyltransferase
VPRDLSSRIVRRTVRARAPVGPELADALAAYLELLAKWNRKINLTGLPVDPPSEEAIDRLIVEPVAAARFVGPDESRAIDVGSGGGSPALPLKLAVPRLEFLLVESKARKAAFLREAVRQLGLASVDVECTRLEELRPRSQPADLATVRAVRVDRVLIAALAPHVRPSARLFVFTGASTKSLIGEGDTHLLVPELRSRLIVLRPQFSEKNG